MKQVYLYLFMMVFTMPAQGVLRVNHLSVNRGLSQQDVETTIQDRYGFMWFGTYDGLNRYDGYNIETFRFDPNLPNTIADNRITALFEDINGRIWIGTEGSGLLYFDPDTDQFGEITHPSISSGKCGSIYDLLEISDQRLLIGSTHGLYIMNNFRSKNSFVELLLPNIRVQNLSLDADKMIWIGTQQGAYRVAISKKNFTSVVFQDNSNRSINGIVKVDNDHYAIYGEGGIAFFDLSSNAASNDNANNDLLTDETVLNMLWHNNTWLIATRHSILSWDGAHMPTQMFSHTHNFFENNILQEITIGRGNNLWISSRNKGVAQIDLNPAKFIEYELPAKDLFVKAMIIRHDGRKVIGIKDYGLLIETRVGSGVFKMTYKGATIASLMEDTRGDLWFFSRQMHILSDKTGESTLSSYNGYKSEMGEHMSSCEDKRGNVWVSTSRGIGKVDRPNQSVSYIPFPENALSSSENLSLSIYYDHFNDAIFCSTKEEGLYRYDITKNKLQQLSYENGLSSNHVWCSYIENDSTVWVGTDVGVNRLSFINGTFTIRPISSDPRIRNVKVMAITKDTKNNLWFSTSQGLFAFNTESSQILEFGFSDGLLSNTLSEVAFMDTEGLVWISSISGLNYFDPLKLKSNPYEPDVVLRDFKIFNKSVIPNIAFNKHIILTKSLLETKDITLHYNENNFQFEVAPIHYSNPQKNKIAYKLSDIDKNWVETRNRMISYNSLPAGNYVLQIKAANSDGLWSSNMLTMHIKIKHAPWFSWWAYLLYLVIIKVLVYLMLRYFMAKRKLKIQLDKELMEHNNERQLNEAKLRFHTNITHEIRTPLALIVAPLYELMQIRIKDVEAQKHIKTIAENTDVLTRLVNQFLDFRKTVTMNYPLQVAESDIRTTIDNAVSIFAEQAKIKGINYQYICDPDLIVGWYDEEKISKVIINIISNAFKYTSKDGSIFVFLEQSEDNVQITIEDTGRGIAKEDIPNIFNRYFQTDSNLEGGTGIGLSLAKQLIEIHHGSIAVKSQLGSGSTFTIQFPIIKEAFEKHEITPKEQLHSKPIINTLINDVENTPHKVDITTTDKPIVLLVEDNLDLADYMINSLNKKYRVYHTTNGNQGLELALVHTPDIILSDIMIEGMDGIQLTQTLKNDIRTSHIPIIIISARTTEDEVMEGLNTGAEDYLAKPFNPKVLKIKIANLIKLSQRSRSNEHSTDQVPQLCDREQTFVDELTTIVIEEMINADFNIEFVCKKLGTNRMQLHRKMMTILGMTTSEFIKQVRFNHAKMLLETTDMNISETMYEIGLSSLYSFTQTFKKLFNINPSDIIKNRKRKT